MKELPRKVLKDLIYRYGPAIAQDPLRCEGLLRDSCETCNREIFVLVNSARQKIPTDLLTPRQSLPFSLMKGFLVKRLQDELAFSGDAAHWAIESWAYALGLSENEEAHKFEEKSPAPSGNSMLGDPADRAVPAQVRQWSDDLTMAQLSRRLDAIRGLSRTDGIEPVRILIKALDNSLFPVREAAYDALAARGDAVAPLIIEALGSPSAGIVWRSALLLGGWRLPVAAGPLAEILNQGGKVRLCAIWALGEIGSRESSTPLLKFMNDPDSAVRNETVAALKKIGGS